MKKLNYRSNVSGQVLVIVIILILLLGGGLWFLVTHKDSVDKEARASGREMITRITVNHDAAFLANHLSPQARLDNPPMQQQELMTQLQQLGVPSQPIQIDEKITWESQFFEPRGFFTAHLNYPAGPATLEIAIDHPVSKWQLLNITFTPPRAR
jgi:hypothetical protein